MSFNCVMQSPQACYQHVNILACICISLFLDIKKQNQHDNSQRNKLIGDSSLSKRVNFNNKQSGGSLNHDKNSSTHPDLYLFHLVFHEFKLLLYTKE